MAGALGNAVQDALRGAPDGLTVRELMAELRARGARVSRRAVEVELARAFPSESIAGRVRWFARAADAADAADDGALPAPTGRPLDDLPLRDWQVEAFTAWAANGSRGVVEAVTGTGKTRLAIAATRAALHHGGRALVLVPTLELQQQWVRELRSHVPGARIGRLGGGEADDLHDHHVVVSTPHSAAPLPIEPPTGGPGLLVADEAHRYGAPTWGAALKPGFPMRLALTATYERSDDGLVDVLGPYFGPVVCTYGYDRAVPDGVVAPFRVAFAGTALDDHEAKRYAALDRQVRDLHGTLVGQHGLSADPRRMFQQLARMVADADQAGHRGSTRVALARMYLSQVRARRDVAAQCAGKLDVVRAIAPTLADHADRSLMFCDTVEQAEQAALVLRRAGLAAETVHGDLDRKRRRIRLAQFRKGNLDVLVAPRVLDEGVDVPEADVAVVLAAFRTRRQMVQRLGRVLRLKADGRHARLVIAFAKQTREDPDLGGHDDFLREITDVATSLHTIDVDDHPESLHDFLREPGVNAA